jgi:hypothetical protein
MSNPTLNKEPSLQAPGAGLPFFEQMFARFYLFPKFCRTTSWDAAQKMFDREGQRILELVTPLQDDQLQKRVLVDRIPGMEDSSRFWSASMTLEHLMIVGDAIATGIIEVSHNKPPSTRADIAAVKPHGKLHSRLALESFKEFLHRFAEKMNHEVADKNSKMRFRHPWFGDLNAHQWHCLAAIHQNTHRKQVQAILKGL